MKKLVSAKANDDLTLDLQFNDGKIKRLNMKPYVDFLVFQELKNIDYFKNIKIAFGTVQWKNEQDISPEILYLESEEIRQEESVLAV